MPPRQKNTLCPWAGGKARAFCAVPPARAASQVRLGVWGLAPAKPLRLSNLSHRQAKQRTLRAKPQTAGKRGGELAISARGVSPQRRRAANAAQLYELQAASVQNSNRSLTAWRLTKPQVKPPNPNKPADVRACRADWDGGLPHKQFEHYQGTRARNIR